MEKIKGGTMEELMVGEAMEEMMVGGPMEQMMVVGSRMVLTADEISERPRRLGGGDPQQQ